MDKSNFERMIDLAEEVFDSRNDEMQLDVDEKVIESLTTLHPSSVSEFDDGNGPVVWVLLIPTTTDIMRKFLENKITETDILTLTEVDKKYDAIYLCSAMVLEEYRKKGIAKKMTINAIKNIQKDNCITNLFVWPFTGAGAALALTVANSVNLPLHKRK